MCCRRVVVGLWYVLAYVGCRCRVSEWVNVGVCDCEWTCDCDCDCDCDCECDCECVCECFCELDFDVRECDRERACDRICVPDPDRDLDFDRSAFASSCVSAHPGDNFRPCTR